MPAQEKQDVFINNLIFLSHGLLEPWLVAAVLTLWEQATANKLSACSNLYEGPPLETVLVWNILSGPFFNTLHGRGCSALRQIKKESVCVGGKQTDALQRNCRSVCLSDGPSCLC